MKIKYHKKFEKQFKKLSEKTKEKTIEVIKLFISDPNNKKLLNHALKGALEGKRAISINIDLRIIFEEFDNYTFIIFFDLGTHDRVYK
jgi:addiction module RelE/StbE family toxin